MPKVGALPLLSSPRAFFRNLPGLNPIDEGGYCILIMLLDEGGYCILIKLAKIAILA